MYVPLIKMSPSRNYYYTHYCSDIVRIVIIISCFKSTIGLLDMKNMNRKYSVDSYSLTLLVHSTCTYQTDQSVM